MPRFRVTIGDDTCTWRAHPGVTSVPASIAARVGPDAATLVVSGHAFLVTSKGNVRLEPQRICRTPGVAGAETMTIVWESTTARGPEQDDATRSSNARPRDASTEGSPLEVQLEHGDRIPITGQPLFIGRDHRCDIRPVDSQISPFHCALWRRGQTTVVLDLGTQTGTFLGGIRAFHCEITEPARLRVGGTSLRLTRSVRATSSELPTPEVALPSEAMRRIDRLCQRVAKSSVAVVIEGEGSVGKTTLAQRLHVLSRRQGSFVPLNACSLNAEIAASELFGHARGAFTGADFDRQGAFFAANGGTLLLNNVHQLAPPLQTSLLRAVDHGRIRRLGCVREIATDVRLVCTADQSLAALVGIGKLRADLWHRLRVIGVCIPPLRRRPEDVVALAKHFAATQPRPRSLTTLAAEKLAGHIWPGNIAELRSTLTRACTDTDALRLSPRHITFAPTRRTIHILDPLIHDAVMQTLADTGANIPETSRLLELRREAVRRHLRAEWKT